MSTAAASSTFGSESDFPFSLLNNGARFSGSASVCSAHRYKAPGCAGAHPPPTAGLRRRPYIFSRSGVVHDERLTRLNGLFSRRKVVLHAGLLTPHSP